MTDEQLELVAQEFVEGAKAVHKFLALPRTDKVEVVKYMLDKQVGTDAGALWPTIPGVPIPPSLVESLTDPLLDKLAELVVGWLSGDGE